MTRKLSMELTSQYIDFHNNEFLLPIANVVKKVDAYETKARELGLAIKNNNNEAKFKLWEWFWNKNLMEIPDWINQETVMNAHSLEEKLNMLTWRTNIDLANTCWQLSLTA